jgi:hypothetical protein
MRYDIRRKYQIEKLDESSKNILIDTKVRGSSIIKCVIFIGVVHIIYVKDEKKQTLKC